MDNAFGENRVLHFPARKAQSENGEVLASHSGCFLFVPPFFRHLLGECFRVPSAGRTSLTVGDHDQEESAGPLAGVGRIARDDREEAADFAVVLVADDGEIGHRPQDFLQRPSIGDEPTEARSQAMPETQKRRLPPAPATLQRRILVDCIGMMDASFRSKPSVRWAGGC